LLNIKVEGINPVSLSKQGRYSAKRDAGKQRTLLKKLIQFRDLYHVHRNNECNAFDQLTQIIVAGIVRR